MSEFGCSCSGCSRARSGLGCCRGWDLCPGGRHRPSRRDAPASQHRIDDIDFAEGIRSQCSVRAFLFFSPSFSVGYAFHAYRRAQPKAAARAGAHPRGP